MTSPIAQAAPIDFKLRPAAKAAPAVAGPRLEPKFEVDRFDADRYRLPERDMAREMITTDKYDARPATMGPHGRRGAGWNKPAKGVSVGTDLGDGWRLDGTASPKHMGTLGVGVSRKF